MAARDKLVERHGTTVIQHTDATACTVMAEHAGHGIQRAGKAGQCTQHATEKSGAAYYSAAKQSTLQFIPSSNSIAKQSQLIRVSGLRAASSGWRSVKVACSVLLGRI